MSTENRTLPNGAEIKVIDYDRGIVLAYWKGNYEPWITWEYYRDDLRSTSHGHYFKIEGEARADFVLRQAGIYQ